MGKILRNKSIKIRVTEAEKIQLLERAGDLALAEFMRDFCLSAKPVQKRKHREPPPVAPELLFELSALGNNLNQIARRVNSTEFSAADSVHIITLLNAISSDLKAIKKGHSHDC